MLIHCHTDLEFIDKTGIDAEALNPSLEFIVGMFDDLKDLIVIKGKIVLRS